MRWVCKSPSRLYVCVYKYISLPLVFIPQEPAILLVSTFAGMTTTPFPDLAQGSSGLFKTCSFTQLLWHTPLVQAFGGRGRWISDFKAKWVCIVSSKIARAIYRERPCLKQANQLISPVLFPMLSCSSVLKFSGKSVIRKLNLKS